MSKPPRPLEERFWEKVSSYADDGCWIWGSTLQRHGYGIFFLPTGALGVDQPRKRLAHRMAYMFLVGPIPEGLVLDHLCRNKRCVNPSHLEPVTQHENIMRGDRVRYNAKKTHCPQGHEYAGANLYVTTKGGRSCRACERDRHLRKRQGASVAVSRHQEGEGTR